VPAPVPNPLLVFVPSALALVAFLVSAIILWKVYKRGGADDVIKVAKALAELPAGRCRSCHRSSQDRTQAQAAVITPASAPLRPDLRRLAVGSLAARRRSLCA
jgi:hypothetical protein